jgi:hypothetical protein
MVNVSPSRNLRGEIHHDSQSNMDEYELGYVAVVCIEHIEFYFTVYQKGGK